MDQEKETKSKLLEQGEETPIKLTYKVDNQHLESLKQGFLFGISASDLFILLAALLAVIVLQLGPKSFEYLQSSQMTGTDSGGEAPIATNSSLHRSITPPNQATESGKGNVVTEKVYCKSPRPEVCTQECLIGPPYICGSDGRAHCSPCQACANPKIEWYVLQSIPCGAAETPSL